MNTNKSREKDFVRFLFFLLLKTVFENTKNIKLVFSEFFVFCVLFSPIEKKLITKHIFLVLVVFYNKKQFKNRNQTSYEFFFFLEFLFHL